MKCNEAEEFAVEAVGDALPPDLQTEVFGHLGVCPRCRREADLEIATRNTVRDALPHTRTPAQIRQAILRAIKEERHASSIRMRSSARISRWFVRPPLIAVATAVLALWYLTGLRSPWQVQTDGGGTHVNIVSIAEENLAKARAGTLRPAVIAAEREEIREYLRQHRAAFASFVDLPARGEWYGASVTEHDGIPLAHVVCKIGDDLMYVFEVQEPDVRRDADLQVPAGAMDGIARRGWFSDKGLGGRAVVFWRENQTLCAAASTMEPHEMLAVLAEREAL